MKTNFSNNLFTKEISYASSCSIKGGLLPDTEYTTDSPDGEDTRTFTYDENGKLKSVKYCD